MTGTSCDGVDAVLVTFNINKETIEHRLESYHHFDMDPAYQSMARKVFERENIRDGFVLGKMLSQKYVECIHQVLLDHQITDPSQINFVCVSGHTLFHLPPHKEQNGLTIDTTDLSLIAALTNITTIGRFRQKDMAFGGHGAPLVPFAHGRLFGMNNEITLVQNMGGIGNVTLLDQDQTLLGFDTGIGNAWMDQVMKWHSNATYDDQGKIAKKGSVDKSVVDELLMHPFFQQKPPKSTGLETLGLTYLQNFQNKLTKMRHEDAMATVTYATAKTVADAYQDFILSSYNPKHVIVCGGGAFNKTFLFMLSEMLPDIQIQTSLDYDIHPQAVEALCFAYLGLFQVQGKNNVYARITGSFKDNMGGEIAHADPSGL